MSSGLPPHGRSWKPADRPGPPPSGPRPGWHPTERPAPRAWNARRLLIALAAVATVATAAVFAAVLLWPRPPRPVRLVLIGAGYETNLAVPHNVPGRQGLRDLGHWAEDHNTRWGRRGRPLLEVRAGELGREGDAVARGLQDCHASVVVLFLGAHGGADADGAFFLAHDADLADDTSLYRLDRVLDQLRALPAQTKKLLLLDATQVEAHWPSGQLQNDFARGLERQRHLIDRIPNLVVISSSDHDQRSWVAPEWRRTAFAHFVLEGLRGAADRASTGNGDGRVNALELYEYARDNVKRWAWRNRAALQTPVLIGDEAVARSIELAPAGDDEEESVPPLAPLAGREQIEDVWSRCERLRAASPHPAAYSPHLWRKYLDGALRHEELVRAGDLESAARMDAILRGVETQIGLARTAGTSGASRLTLAMPSPAGERLSPAEEQLVRRFEAGWSWDRTAPAPLEQFEALLPKGAKVPGPGSLVALALQDVVLRKLEQEPQRLADACAALDRLGGRRPDLRPAEAHLAVMLQGGTSREGRSRVAALFAAGKGDLVSQALRVRRLAEQAALGLGAERPEERATLPAYSEQVVPHVRDVIEEADTERRLGEDLLFTTDGTRWDEAGRRLEAAGHLYAQAQRTALHFRRALHVHNRALTELPYYTRWPLADEAILVGAWERVHALDAKLANPKVAATDAAAAAARLDEDLTALGRRVQEAPREELKALQPTWHRIESLLRLPFLPARERVEFVLESQRISHALNEATPRASDASGPDLEPAQRGAARRQARLALAELGPDWKRGPLDGASWEARLREARSVWSAVQELPGRAERMTAQAAGEGPAPAAVSLADAAAAARRTEGGAVGTRLTLDPVGEQRRLLLSELLRWQAERTFRDFWAAEPGGSRQPYYRESADLFLRDARALAVPARLPPGVRVSEQRSSAIDVLARRVNTRPHEQLAFQWRAGGGAWSDFSAGRDLRLDLSDEKQAARVYRLASPPGAQGEPAVWVEPGKGLGFPPGQVHRRAFAAFKTPLPVSFVADVPANGNGSFRSRFDVVGLFRGHEVRAGTQVRYYQQPDLVLLQPLREPRGRIALQTRLDEAGNNALAIVLDCSGSMNYKVRGGGTRFEKLIKALLEVMDRLPPGVTVSLRVFGGLGNPTAAETARVWGPRPWLKAPVTRRNAPAPVTRAELRRVLTDLAGQLGGGTPLVRAVWEARDDFPEEFDGFKTVVVLTDGVDSTFAIDARLPKKADDTTAAFLPREFDRSGVVVNVIGFELGELSDEEKKLQKDFEEAIRGVGGEYQNVGSGKDLAAPVERAMRHLRFEVGADRGASAPGPLPAGPIDVVRADEAGEASWRWSPPLDTGAYQARVAASRLLRQRAEVGPGDHLLLELVRDGEDRLAMRRALFAASPQVRRARHLSAWWRGPGKDQRDWLLAVLQNEPHGRGLELTATLEKDEGIIAPGEAVQQVRPREVWFRVTGREDAERTSPLRVVELPDRADRPAPAWGLTLSEWSSSEASPVLETWWAETDIAAARLLRRGLDFRGLADLDYATFSDVTRLAGEPSVSVTVESARVERRAVAVEPGTIREDVPCLVVRLNYDPSAGPFFVRLPGQDVGQEHRFYFEAGRYTGVFWTRGMKDVPDPRILHLISVAALKERALSKSLPLDRPDPARRRPGRP